jgi:hypothetical protein
VALDEVQGEDVAHYLATLVVHWILLRVHGADTELIVIELVGRDHLVRLPRLVEDAAGVAGHH